MNERLVTIKAAVAAFFTTMSAFLGWQGVLLVVWVAAMLIDYLSGSLAAWLSGKWSSAVAREGLKHKAGMFFAVIVAGMADITLIIICDHLPIAWAWPVLVLPLVLAWYILTELGSILENAVKMGAPMPEWLLKLLQAGLKIIDSRGDALPDDAAAYGTEEVKTELEETVK